MSRASVLIVDDKKANVQALQALLNDHFPLIKIKDVDNGEDALKIANSKRIDLIILDVQMPGMSGFEVASFLKKNPNTKDIPVIFLTAVYKSDEFEEKGYDLGAIEYFTKPINEKQFINRIALYVQIFEKNYEIQKQRKLLQAILDSETNLTLTTDFDRVAFANRAFLDFFGVDDLKECKKQYSNVLNIFLNNKFYSKEDFIDDLKQSSVERGEKFFHLIQEMDERARVVSLADKNGDQHSFYINITPLLDSKEQNNYLITLTDITQIAIEKRDILKKAYIDGLTGIYNRYKFEELFEYQLKQSKRYNKPLSIAIVDIDKFKSFNDNYGHIIGDEMLILLAHVLNESVRKSDVFARWGGEEFIILFNEADLESAIKISENLKQKVQRLEHEKTGKITASFGVAEYKEGETLEEVFERADRALYEAKNSGRNRVRAAN